MKRRWPEGAFNFCEAISQAQPEIKIVKVILMTINSTDNTEVEEW